MAEPENLTTPSDMDAEQFERYRSELKWRMLQSFGPDHCAQRPCASIEEVLSLIAKGEADVLFSFGSSGRATQYFAVRFKDPELSHQAREDSLALYGLRAPS